MKKAISVIVLSLFVFIGLRGDTQYKYINSWDADVYFGHVIYPEAKNDGKDAVVFREGHRSPEIADINLPLAPGDTIKTSERRCEIQFDTGTIIRLDRESELKIETILAQSLSSKNLLTNLLLKQGQAFIMYKRYIRKEMFQIITPNATLKLDHKSVALIHVKPEGDTDVVIKEGRAHMLYGANENAIKAEIIKKPHGITVTAGHKMVQNQYEPVEDFEEWNKEINKEFLDLHEGKAVLPLPIQKLPKSIFYFAQKYGSLHGEWLYDRYLGYVWRPFLNDHAYPGGGAWMPYYHGRWTSLQGQLFWVPYERWGWVPYHLGIWMWNKTKGWLWIPGSVFAPAWVDWTCYGASFSWRPWLVTDWYGYDIYRGSQFAYFAHFVEPGEEPGIDGVTPGPSSNVPRQVLTKEQLKSKKPAPYPVPKEMKETYKRVVAALQNGEDWALSPLREMPNHMLVVNQKDLNSPRIHEKVVKLTNLSAEMNKGFLSAKPQAQSPQRMAEQTYLRNEKMVALHEKIDNLINDLKGLKALEDQTFQLSKVTVDSKTQDKKAVTREPRVSQIPEVQVGTSLQKQINPTDRTSGSRVSGQPGRTRSEISRSYRSVPRFRDWNPDATVARRAGISIRYSSRTNEVRCPELNISSRNVSGSRGYTGPSVRLTSRGSVTVSGSSGATYSGGSSSSSSSRGGGSSSSSSSKSNAGSKGAGSSGKIKK